MKIIYLLWVIFLCCFALLHWQCDRKEITEPIEIPQNQLSVCKLTLDSINIKIHITDSVAVKTDKGDMFVSFRNFDDACVNESCAFCDLEGAAFLSLSMDKEYVKLPYIVIPRCPKINPTIFRHKDICTYSKHETTVHSTQYISFGKKYFVIKEISPYPNSREEVALWKREKKYVVDLIIKNHCQ